MSDSDDDTIEVEGPPIANTLENVLRLFPLQSRKRKRDEAPPSPPPQQTLLNSILFPTVSDQLSDSMHRIDFKRVRRTSALMAPVPRSTVPSASAPLADHLFAPPNEIGVALLYPYRLYPYQASAIRWMIEIEEGRETHPHFRPGVRGFAYFASMGLGKTLTISHLIVRSLSAQRGAGQCTLYVCPKHLLGTVTHEFFKFYGGRVRTLIYHRDFLRSAYNSMTPADLANYDVIITNYATVSTRSRSRRDTNMVLGVEWYRIILDESHEIRTSGTQRTKAIHSLKSSRRYCMTGTPIHNRVLDLINQLTFCGYDAPQGNTKYTADFLTASGLSRMIKFVQYKDSEGIVLPEKTVHTSFFALSPRERAVHDSLRCNAQSVFEKSGSLQVLASIVRMLQVCSAPVLITPAGKALGKNEDMMVVEALEAEAWLSDPTGPAGIRSSKMQHFVALLNDLDHKTVVFANFTSTLTLAVMAMVSHRPSFEHEHVFVHGRIGSSKVRDDMYTRFRTDPACRVLFMTLKLGVGLNLTEARNVIFIEPWYSYSALNQAEGRVHRIGQLHPVNIYYILARDTTEERVYRIAMDKKKLSDDVLKRQDSNLDMDVMRQLIFMEQ